MAQKVVMVWQGETYVIPEDRAFEAGEAVEDVVTLAELTAMQARPRFHRLARAYAEMLRVGGANVTPSEVHAHMMAQMKGMAPTDKDSAAIAAISSLVALLMDGMPSGGSAPEGKVTGGSSKRRTK